MSNDKLFEEVEEFMGATERDGSVPMTLSARDPRGTDIEALLMLPNFRELYKERKVRGPVLWNRIATTLAMLNRAKNGNKDARGFVEKLLGAKIQW